MADVYHCLVTVWADCVVFLLFGRLCMVQEQFVHHPQPARRRGILVVHVVAAEFFSFAHLKVILILYSIAGRISRLTFISLLVQSLGVADDIALEFHYSLGHAISAAQERDQILLLPGVHTCAGLPWIDKDITVEGKAFRYLQYNSADSVMWNTI